MRSPVDLFTDMRDQAADVGLDVVGVRVRDATGDEAGLELATSSGEAGRIARFAAMTAQAPSGRHLEVGVGVTVAVPAEITPDEADDVLALVADLVDGRLTAELAAVQSGGGPVADVTHLTQASYFEALIEDIAAASDVLLMASPWTGHRMKTLIGPLCEAVARGVQVTLLIKPSHAQSADWRWAQQNLWEPLRNCGVVIHEYREDMHEKFVVIDGNITYQGSLNPGSHKDTTESSLRIIGTGPAEVILNLYHPNRGASAAAKEVRVTRPTSAARLGGEQEALQGGAWTESIRWESRASTGPYTPPDELFGDEMA